MAEWVNQNPGLVVRYIVGLLMDNWPFANQEESYPPEH